MYLKSSGCVGVLGFTLLCFLVGCGSKSPSEFDVSESAYSPPDAGLIRNQGFDYGHGKELPLDWSSIGHSSRGSYVVDARGGVVSIARVGHEPWGSIRQLVKRSELKDIQGRLLEFSADVSGEFTGEYGVPIAPTSLSVVVKGFPEGAKRMLGAKIILSENVSVAMEPGVLEWASFKLPFKLPSLSEAEVTSVDLRFTLTLGGVMSIRGPSLLVVE